MCWTIQINRCWFRQMDSWGEERQDTPRLAFSVHVDASGRATEGEHEFEISGIGTGRVSLTQTIEKTALLRNVSLKVGAVLLIPQTGVISARAVDIEQVHGSFTHAVRDYLRQKFLGRDIRLLLPGFRF